MGQFVLKNITFELNEASIQNAIDEVNKLKEGWIDVSTLLDE